MGRLVGGTLRMRCSGIRPEVVLELGEVGDIDGVVDVELWLPRPDPGRLDRSQALYCSAPRPEPGRDRREKAALDSSPDAAI